MTDHDGFERGLGLLFEAAPAPETDRATSRALLRKLLWGDAVRRMLQAMAYAACAGAIGWFVIPVLTGALGWDNASALWLGALGGAGFWGGAIARD